MPQSRGSLSFPGTASCVELSGSAFEFATASFTVGFWLKTTDATHFGVIGTWAGGAGWLMALGGSFGKACFAFYGPGGNRDPYPVGFGGGNLTDGVWHHVVCVYVRDGSGTGLTMNLYIDGAFAGSTGNAGNTSIGGSGPLQIGTYNTTANSLICQMDDVFVAPSVLTAGQIAAIANGSLDPAQLTTTGLWRFEEGSGTNAYDSSGNGNTGTLIRGPTWSADTPNQLKIPNQAIMLAM